jgi:hypothetical protein
MTSSGVVTAYGYATTGAAGTGSTGTVNFSGNYLFPLGLVTPTQVTVRGVAPLGYSVGTVTATAPTTAAPSGSAVSFGTTTTGPQTAAGVVLVNPATGNYWDESNPIRIIGDGPVQTCWKFSPPAPTPPATNAGLFAIGQPTIGATTNRGQNAGIEIAGISFIGPQSFGDTSCAIGVDNVTAPYIHDNWFQGWVGDPNYGGASGNNVGGCAIEIYGYMTGGSLGANIDRNRFGFEETTTPLSALYSLPIMAQTGVRYPIWLNGPYNTGGRVNDVNITANRFEAYLVGGVRIEGIQRPIWGATEPGSSQDTTSEKNKYFTYISHSMERNTLYSGASPTDFTLAGSGGAVPPYAGSSLAGLVARIQTGTSTWEGAYITAAATSTTREVLLFSASGTLGTSTSSYVTLAAGSAMSSTGNDADNFYNGATIVLTSGTCMGDSGTVTGYSGTTMQATVSLGCSSPTGAAYTITPSWDFAPPVSVSAQLTGGATSNVTLAATSSTVSGYYTNASMTMTSGVCNGQTATITAYAGSSYLATVTFSGCMSGGHPAAMDNYTITSLPGTISGALSTLAGSTTATSVTLPVGSSWASSYYVNGSMTMTSGNCNALTAPITVYAPLTLVANVSFTGCTGSGYPSPGDTYKITPAWWVSPAVVPAMPAAALTGGTATTVTLAAGSSTVDNFYTNAVMTMTSGTCNGDTATITNYVGSTLVATVVFTFSGSHPISGNNYTINANYEIGYADFAGRAEWSHPIALGHAFYWAQNTYKLHSRGDYFENTVELVASGSNANCVLAATPIYCQPPNADPVVDFVAPENEVTRGVSTIYEDGSFFMPMNLQAVDPYGSGQINTHAVLGSLTLTDPRLFGTPAPLMTLCLNTTNHTLSVGDVVALAPSNGSIASNNLNYCIDPATYASGGTGTAVEYPCFIVTAPGTALATTFPAGQPVTIALPGSQVLASIWPSSGSINSGALLLPHAPGGTSVSGTLTGIDTASATTQQVAQACATAIGVFPTASGSTMIKATAGAR